MQPAPDHIVPAGLDTSSDWLHAAMAAAHIIAWAWDGEAGTVALAGDPVSMIGMADARTDAESLLRLINPEDQERVVSAWIAACDAERDFVAEFRVRSPGQGERWLMSSGRVWTSYARGVVMDITDRKRAERESAEAETRYRRIVETATEAILILDTQGRITFGNAAACVLIGFEAEELIGRSIFDSVYVDDLPAAEARFTRRKDGTRDRYEIRVRRKDGTLMWLDISSTPMLDESGRFLGALAMATNITERKAADAELARHREAIERSNADLQQFAYATSHDLQEPLRTINSYIQLLSNRYGAMFDQEAREFLSFITGAVERMDRLIHDLLAYSRVVNRQMPPFEEVRLDGIVQWAMMNLQHSIRESGATVRLERLPMIRGDRTELVQLFQNLLGNAIKYRCTDPPVIEVSAQRVGDDWRIAVHDNGIGIAPEYHVRIFDLFKRLHGREYPGTGLGLAIAKRIVEMHGGRIWVESEGHSGSVFYFTLPV